jgi:hypothetical protein
MTLYIAAQRDLTVHRPLTFLELLAVRDAIDADAAGPFEMVDQVAGAVFAALRGEHTEGEPDRRRYAIPGTQWTAIAGAVTDRAAAWGASVEAGMQLAAVLPDPYDDPGTPSPQLECADRRPRLSRIEITREAADTITSCHDHLADLSLAYGIGSSHHLAAAGTWQHALARIFGAPNRGNSLVQPAGPLSLVVSADTEPSFAVTFRGEPHRCALDGCQAVRDAPADTEPQWRPAAPGAVVREHDHEPHYPLGRPSPGVWVQHG